MVDAHDSGSCAARLPGSSPGFRIYNPMLTSLQNALVKQFRRLQSAKYRREEQLFLLEGTHLIQEAVAAGWPLATVCYTESWLAREAELLEQIISSSPSDLRCEVVSVEVLVAMATTVQPDGVVALAHAQTRDTLSIQSLGLVLEDLQDPGNVGTILRTAAASGVEGILLGSGTADLANPKVLRASAGAWFRVLAARSDDLVGQVMDYRDRGFQVLATVPKADRDCWSVDYIQPTLILVGNEGAGLSETLIQAATLQVRIPLSAGVESLNAATATAVLLFEAKRQRTVALSVPS